MKKLVFIGILSFVFVGCSNPDSVDFKDLEFETLAGEKVALSQYVGKKVFLNFWATWCGPCRAELPSMQQASEALADEGYVFLLVSDEATKTIQAFKDRQPFTFNYLKKPSSIKLLGIFSIPQTYLINTQGDVVQAIEGAHNWSSDDNMALLRSID